MHEHHRDRVRARYRAAGFDGFAPHELLEFLLFYSNPRRDTNELAHRLMERFGSFSGVVESSREELMTVDGVGERTADLLNIVAESIRRYAIESLSEIPSYNSLSVIGDYLCRRFVGYDHECVYMMMLDNGMHLIDCCKISEGGVNSSLIPISSISKRALLRKAPIVVLAHNHPKGYAIPSESDIEVTSQLRTALSHNDILLMEHLIVVGDQVFPIMRDCLGILPCLPNEVLRAQPSLPESFYDIDPQTWHATVFPTLLKKNEENLPHAL